MSDIYNQTIALAGLWQAADLVNTLATKGELDRPQLRRVDTSLNSLFVSSGESAASIFGGLGSIEYGVHGLAAQLERKIPETQSLMYVVSVLGLRRRLTTNAAMVSKIGSDLKILGEKYPHPDHEQQQLLREIAELYVATLGSLPANQRIRIYGDKMHLQKAEVQEKVRVLLLAAVRSAMLWHQFGGSRWSLLLHRKRIQRCLQQIS